MENVRVSDGFPFLMCFQQRPKVQSRSHDAVIRVYDAAGNVIETHEHIGDFKEP